MTAADTPFANTTVHQVRCPVCGQPAYPVYGAWGETWFAHECAWEGSRMIVPKDRACKKPVEPRTSKSATVK